MVRTNAYVWAKKWQGRTEPVNAFARTLVRRLGVGRNRRILDIGCGNGTDSLLFARYGFSVTAIDFSESGIAALQMHAKEWGLKQVEAQLHDLSKPLRYADCSFDVIYAHLSLHYFDDRTTRKIVSEIYRVLKPNGIFFIKCKSVEDALYGIGEKVGPDMYRLGHVRHFFTKEYLRSLLDRFGILDLRKTSSFFHAKKSAFVQAICRKT